MFMYMLIFSGTQPYIVVGRLVGADIGKFGTNQIQLEPVQLVVCRNTEACSGVRYV